MAFNNTILNVQSGDYFDTPNGAFPGMLASVAESIANVVKSYGVVEGITPDDNGIPLGYLAGFIDFNGNDETPGAHASITMVTTDTQLRIAGIAVRSWLPVNNVNDTTGGTPTTNQQIAGYLAGTVASILPIGRRSEVYVGIPIGQTVTYGDDVYAAHNPTNDAGNIPIGAITNDSGGTFGLVQIPGAIFIDSLTATADIRVVRIRI